MYSKANVQISFFLVDGVQGWWLLCASWHRVKCSGERQVCQVTLANTSLLAENTNQHDKYFIRTHIIAATIYYARKCILLFEILCQSLGTLLLRTVHILIFSLVIVTTNAISHGAHYIIHNSIVDSSFISPENISFCYPIIIFRKTLRELFVLVLCCNDLIRMLDWS